MLEFAVDCIEARFLAEHSQPGCYQGVFDACFDPAANRPGAFTPVTMHQEVAEYLLVALAHGEFTHHLRFLLARIKAKLDLLKADQPPPLPPVPAGTPLF